MSISEYQQREINKKKEQAIQLYKTGLSLRAVSKVVGRSHEWVRQALKRKGGVDMPIK